MQVLRRMQPFFQYQFNQYKVPIGAEILMRDSIENTQDLILKLEQENQILNLDLLAFKAAIAWRDKYKLPCASNFSGLSLADPKIVDFIVTNEVLGQTTIELTEQSKLSEQALEHLDFLSYYGFKISLDDFGSGHNGLNRSVRLRELVKEIKIDKYLVRNLANRVGRAAIASTLQFCHNVGCDAVFEGVEEQWQFDILIDMGATRFQGYFFHEPEVLC